MATEKISKDNGLGNNIWFLIISGILLPSLFFAIPIFKDLFTPDTYYLSEKKILSMINNNTLKTSKYYEFIVPDIFDYAYIPTFGEYGPVYYAGQKMITNEAVFISRDGLYLMDNISGLRAGLLRLENSEHFYQMGLEYWNEYKYKEAEKYLIQARENISDIYSQSHSDVARINNSLGSLYTDMSRYNEAHELLLSAILAFDKKSSEGITARLNMASLLRAQGEFKYKKAISYLKENIEVISDDSVHVEYELHIATYYNLALLYSDLGEKKSDFDIALQYCYKALEISEAAFGKNHEYTAASYSGIAGIYFTMGDYDEALKYHMIIREINSLLDLDEDINTELATTYNNDAILYDSMGQYNTALEHCQEGLNIRERVFGSKHIITANSYDSMSNIYQSINDYNAALKYGLKAKMIYEDVLGKEHSNTAKAYNTLSVIYSWLNEFSEAEEYNRLALEIRMAVFGKEHPFVASSYNNQAYILKAQGLYDDALIYFNKSLEIYERLDNEHPDSLTEKNNIASTYQAQGKYEIAEGLFLEVLNVMESRLGNDHPRYAGTLNNLGTLYSNIARQQTDKDTREIYLAKALEYCEKALEIGETIFKPEHTFIAVTCHNLSLIHKDLNELETALNYAERSLFIYESLFGLDSIAIAYSYMNMASFYIDIDINESVEYSSKTVNIFENAFGETHIDTAHAYYMLGATYMEKHQYDDAIVYLEKALPVFEKVYGNDDYRTKQLEFDINIINGDYFTLLPGGSDIIMFDF